MQILICLFLVALVVFINLHGNRCSQLSPGDLVLVKRVAFKGKHKSQDRLDNNVYEVLESCRVL